MGAYIFRKALLRTMAHIQAAEIHSYCNRLQRSTLTVRGMRSSNRRATACMRHPHGLAQSERMGVGVGTTRIVYASGTSMASDSSPAFPLALGLGTTPTRFFTSVTLVSSRNALVVVGHANIRNELGAA